MTAPRRVSVALLSWNGRQHLETCLQALAGQRDPGVPWEVLVLDNGSTDGTVEWLRREHGESLRGGQGAVPLRCIASAVNLGFCAGNNRLVAAAAGDAVALLNNDTRPAPEWLAALVAALAAAAGDVAAVSGKIVDWDGERLDFGRGVMAFDGHAFQLDFRRPLAAARVPRAGEELLFACGGNMLIWRDSFRAAGGFDESYFAYLEDVDLGWRLWSGGERVVFAPEAVVYHRSSATSDLLGLYNRGFLFERNAFLTAYKNYEGGLWERIMPALLLTFLSRTQTMLADNNPGGGSLRIDPYAGWIANTAAPPGRQPPTPCTPGNAPAQRNAPGAAPAQAVAPGAAQFPARARGATSLQSSAPQAAAGRTESDQAKAEEAADLRSSAPQTAVGRTEPDQAKAEEAADLQSSAPQTAAGRKEPDQAQAEDAADLRMGSPEAPESHPASCGAEVSPGAGSLAAMTSTVVSAASPLAVAREPLSLGKVRRRWRELGTREVCRRAFRKLAARLRAVFPRLGGRGEGAPPPYPTLSDERTVAQLRALSYLLSHLEAAAAARRAVQARRRRSDREIFARFPLYLVATYPGDEALFADPGFASWLPADLPVVRQTLREVMEVEE